MQVVQALDGVAEERGERLGRPRLVEPGIVRRIVLDRKAGTSYDKIAAALEADGILSPQGHPKWQPSTVRRIYVSAQTATEGQAS